MIDEVECREESTFEAGAKGTKGVQVVVKQVLKLKEVKATVNKMNYGKRIFMILCK